MKPPLTLRDEKWEFIAKFVKENKSLGYKKLVDKVATKYTLSASVQNEIKKLISK